MALSELMRASHASRHDDFEVSAAPVDALVDSLNAAIGPGLRARMTGGDFGGAVVAVLGRSQANQEIAVVRSGHSTPNGDAAEILFV